MKLLYQGMKKLKKNLWSEKVPFGYEKKPVFENFPFHTLGYENFGCFFLMYDGSSFFLPFLGFFLFLLVESMASRPYAPKHLPFRVPVPARYISSPDASDTLGHCRWEKVHGVTWSGAGNDCGRGTGRVLLFHKELRPNLVEDTM
jgi:hypothetical protein